MAIIKTTDNDKREFDSAISELYEYFTSLGARKGRGLTYNVLTYGCQLNESDSEKLSGMLAEMGLTPSEGGELDAADVIIFNTCSIRENADRHLFGNLGAFKALKKEHRDMIIGIGGPGECREDQKVVPICRPGIRSAAAPQVPGAFKRFDKEQETTCKYSF